MASLTQRAVGRLGALLFLGSGLLTLVLPPPGSTDRATRAAIGAAAIAIGVAAWYAPWQRWPRRATLVLLPPAFALLASSVLMHAYEPATYALYYLVVFVWIGISQRPGTPLLVSPFAALVYLVPLELTYPGAGLGSIWEVMGMSVLVGEGLAWMSKQLRRAEALDSSRLWETQTLLQAAERLGRERDPSHAPDLVATLGLQLLRAEGAAVFLMEDRDRLIGAGAARWPASIDGSSLTVSAFPAVVEGLRSDVLRLVPAPGSGFEPLGAGRFGSLLILPLRGTTSPEGLMIAGFATSDLRLDPFVDHVARTFATLAALTLERVQAVRSLLEESLRDELTGLGNRRAANRALDRLQPGDAVAIADLDHLKELNDSRGHFAGDELLTEFAGQLSASLREGDVACRLGGDEFLLVLRGVGENAEAIVGRLAERWRATAPMASFSAGVTVSSGEGDGDAALERADAALYAAKRAGRDRVVASGEPAGATAARA